MDGDHGGGGPGDSDLELLDLLETILNDLGPFAPGLPRERKWRTTEQLAHEVLDRWGRHVRIDELDRVLRGHEAISRERLRAGLPPAARIRRATYPDRMTVLPLWGSTRHHGQPWAEQSPAQRADSPSDAPPGLEVPSDALRVFVSYTHADAGLALDLARALAERGVGAWRFETHIGQRGDIAACVRSALQEAAGCLALVTRDSVASLWVLTELHAALEEGRPVILVVNAADELLLRLLASVQFQYPEGPFDATVQYDRAAFEELHADYDQRQPGSRAQRYPDQVHDFLASLPAYLDAQPALAFPSPPPDWNGPFGLRPMDDLMDRIGGGDQ